MLKFLVIIFGFLIGINAVASESNSKFKILTNVKNVPPTIGNCHMGYCSWGKPISVHIVQQSTEQAILEVTLLGGESIHDGNDYPNGYNKSVPIDWDKEPHKIVITCSYKHPSVAVDDQITELPLGSSQGVPDVLMSDLNIYFEYCHSFYEGSSGYDNYEGSEKFGYNIQE